MSVLCLDPRNRCSFAPSHRIQGQVACLRAYRASDTPQDAPRPPTHSQAFVLTTCSLSHKTPVPDRATSQHPSNIHKAKHQNANSRAQQKPRSQNSDQSSKSECAIVSKILVLSAPTTRHLGAPAPRPGTRICRHPVPRSGPPFEGLLRCRGVNIDRRNYVDVVMLMRK